MTSREPRWDNPELRTRAYFAVRDGGADVDLIRDLSQEISRLRALLDRQQVLIRKALGEAGDQLDITIEQMARLLGIDDPRVPRL